MELEKQQRRNTMFSKKQLVTVSFDEPVLLPWLSGLNTSGVRQCSDWVKMSDVRLENSKSFYII